ncbi:MAG: multiheme c-type cytochrome, partial [Armatimonadota bacterium]|nr:multiheme c-type cytochrome [Armatimonadota bacterium]
LSPCIFAQKRKINPHQLTIFFTGDDNGQVKNCGCSPKGNLGGVSHRAAYLKRLRETGCEFLVFDTGDVIIGTGRHAEIKQALYSQALPYMGYDAVGMGDVEAKYVKETGKTRIFSESVPLITANVVDSEKGNLIGDEAFIIKTTREGLRVGITSILGDSIIHPTLKERIGVRVLPTVETISKQIETLRKQCDIVIVLSHTGYDTAKELASKVTGIDILLVGHNTGKEMETLDRVGNTILMTSRSNGKYLGKLVLDIGEDGSIKNATGEYVAMDAECGEDEEMERLVAKHDAELREYLTSLSQASSPTVYTTPKVYYETRSPQPYVSALKCRECHLKQYEAWVETPHARAFETLRKEHKENDPACTSCHTTGFQLNQTNSSISANRFWGVQCEACHGPGVIHVRRPSKSFGAVLQSRCLECHDATRQPKLGLKAAQAEMARICKEAGKSPAK